MPGFLGTAISMSMDHAHVHVHCARGLAPGQVPLRATSAESAAQACPARARARTHRACQPIGHCAAGRDPIPRSPTAAARILLIGSQCFKCFRKQGPHSVL